jgi:hypothetical protein
VTTFQIDGQLSVEQVGDVRRFVERMWSGCPDPDLLGRMIVATHELLENAVKFAPDRQVSFRLEIADTRVQITTRNRARSEHVQTLHEIAARLRRSTDNLAFYIDLLKNPVPGPGGLGIGRVAGEADMRLDMEIADDTVVIRAELQEAS